MDRETVSVGVDRLPGEVDGDAGGAVPPRSEPVRPRRQQRESPGVPGPQCIDAPGEREVLASAVPERNPGHADVGQEGRAELAGPELDRRFAAEAALPDRRGQRAGHTSSRFSTRRSPGAYRSSIPGLMP